MRFNLRQIEAFRAIMLTGSISGAAKLLYVSQPAVSRVISHAEQRLGFQLFQRIKGRLYPTPEAKRLFVEVDTVYNGVQRVNEVVDDLIENRSGLLRIACSANLSQSLFPQAIRAFLRHHPDVRIVLHTVPPDALLQNLFAQKVELGIAYMPFAHPSIASQLLYENRIVAVLPSSHRLASQTELRLDDLIDEPFIGYVSDLPFGRLFRQLFDNAQRYPQPRVEVQQVHVACALVEAGIGIALADEQTVHGQNWQNIITRPLVPDVPTPVHVFHLLYEPLSRAAQEFIEVLKSLPIANANG
jgi:DNA-binding transcriptional LysR family regulator